MASREVSANSLVSTRSQTGLRFVWNLLRLGRPHFLVGGFLFHALGAIIAWYTGAGVNVPAWLYGQLAITSIQLMTHYSNDYFDHAADQANATPTHWSGGSRVLVAGSVSPRVALWAALVCAVVALFAALALAVGVNPGSLTLPLLLLSLALAWSYSAPPLRLHTRGLGELTVSLLVPGLTPLVGFYLQAGRLDWLPLLAVLPLCGLQFAMILVINFPDAAGDAAVGKRTLAVRLGGAVTARLYLSLLALVYAALPLLIWSGLPPLAALAMVVPLPLALVQGWRVGRGLWRQPAAWNSLGFWSIVLLIGTTALLCLAFLLLWAGNPFAAH